MDIGAEISKKIQMAITAKLKELEAYVDDELPDYIMIMVANRKTEDQMTEALSLFLANNTRTFTSWLHNLLATLRKAKSNKTSTDVKRAAVTPIYVPDKQKKTSSNVAADNTEPSTQVLKQNFSQEDVKRQNASTTHKPVEQQRASAVKAEAKSNEMSSEAVITINPEMDDIFNEELRMQQNETPVLQGSATAEVHPIQNDSTTTPAVDSTKKVSKKALVTYSEDDKEDNKPQEIITRSEQGGKHRKDGDSRSERHMSDRKRKSEEHRRRHSHRSTSPASRNRKSEKSRERKNSNSTKASAADEESSIPPKKKRHDVRRMYGLESDSKRYAKPLMNTKNKDASAESQMREWDRGKGEDEEEEILSSWDRRRLQEEARSKVKGDADDWVSSEEDDARGKALSSTVNPVSQEGFVSESDSEDDVGTKSSVISSKIAYPERKMRVPRAKQANRALLMKAVSEAEKSVRRKRNARVDDQEDNENDTEYIPTKKSIKQRLSAKADKEWVEKPVKVRKQSSKGEKVKKTDILEKVLRRPMYQDMETEKTQTKQKELIIVHKNIVTGDRTSTTGKQRKVSSQSRHEGEEKESRRKKYPKPAKVILLDDADEEQPVTVIHVRRKNQSKKKKEKVIYVDSSSSENENPQAYNAFRRDERTFIHRERSLETEQRASEADRSADSTVKFDSRHAKSETQASPLSQLRVEGKKKYKATAKVSPRLQYTEVPEQPTTSKVIDNYGDVSRGVRAQSPRFIVTLDGVAAPKSVNIQTGSADNTSDQGYKYTPVAAPGFRPDAAAMPVVMATPKAMPVQNPMIQTSGMGGDHADLTGNASDLELGKMRKKLLKVQEEAMKIKQIQAKLAAAQAQRDLLLQSGGMYADKVETEQRSIYIGNVHYSTTDKQLSEYFSICGKVQRVTILKDPFTGHPKGFAYLEFEDKRAVSSALALDNTSLNGRVIRVTLKQAKPSGQIAVATRGRRFLPRRSFPLRYSPRFYGSRFMHPTPRFRSTFQKPNFTSRNKTWVNPSITTQK